LLLIFLTCGPARAATEAAADDGRRANIRPTADLIVVPDEEPWMMAIAAPLAERLRKKEHPSRLIAVEYPPSGRANWLISRVAPHKTVVLTPRDHVRLGPVLSALEPEIVPLGIDPVAASFALAKRFWKRAHQAVVASADDPEAILLGSLLAEHLSLPLLLREPAETRTALLAALQDLGVKEIIAPVTDAQRPPRWARTKDSRVEVLSRRDVQDRLVAQLGPQNIRTVVVARVPDAAACQGRTGWLAPYWCLAREAPLVLCRTAHAAVVENEVQEFIARYGLRPRSITILADYASIGTEMAEFDAGPQKAKPHAAGAPEPNPLYHVQREPCVPFNTSRAAAYGVGRLPLESLADASVMFARGLMRPHTLADHVGRVLLIANSGIERRPLPLCELISRATAQEFQNWRVPLDEFYGKLADSPEILAAARNANLIIFEGHVAYQDLIYVPYSRVRVPDEYYEEGLDALRNRTPDAPPLPAEPPAEEVPLPATLPEPPEKPNRLEEPLRKLPIVILQSCDSLDEQLLDRVDELGCTAVIGSVTPIHSGSGSMLAHALASALLHRQATVGEALRDAQNFLFCLEDLKVARGSKEHAKSLRVALSFRLWGDPELAVLGELSERPHGKSVSAEWSDAGALVLHTPARHFPEIHSAQYYARMFPGSQVVGLVQKHETSPRARVLGAYYFQLPLPAGFSAANAALQLRNGASNEAVFRLDPLHRFICVLCLPDVEHANETIMLHWAPPEAEKPKSATRDTQPVENTK
jgi:hypothetical protein